MEAGAAGYGKRCRREMLGGGAREAIEQGKSMSRGACQTRSPEDLEISADFFGSAGPPTRPQI